MNKTIEFIKETKAEMTNVKWPSRKQSITFTVAVVAVSVIVAYYLGLFDYIFKIGLESLITK
jgi:preprotein translocase subunit SecE